MSARARVLVIMTVVLTTAAIVLTRGADDSTFEQRTRTLLETWRTSDHPTRRLATLETIVADPDAARIEPQVTAFEAERARDALASMYARFLACLEARQCAWPVLREQCDLAYDVRGAIEDAGDRLPELRLAMPEAVLVFIERCAADPA